MLVAALEEPYANDGHAYKDGHHEDRELEQSLLQASAGPEGALGGAEQTSARPFYLDQNYSDQYYRNDYLNNVEHVTSWGPPP